MTLAEKLRAAMEKKAAQATIIRSLLDKLDNNTWNQDTDGPALEAARTALDACDTEVRDLNDKIALQNRVADQPNPNPVTTNIIRSTGDSHERARADYRLLSAVSRSASGRQLDGLELEMSQEAQREAELSGVTMSGHFGIPSFIANRDLNVGTPSAGGYTVQTNVGNLIPILEPRLVLEAMGAIRMSGLQGNIDFPRGASDAVALWEGETSDADETSPTFDRVQFSPKRLAAIAIYSKKLAIQGNISVENYVRGRMGNAVRRAVDTAGLKGGGSNEPVGILSTAGINTVAIGANGGALTWSHIVGMETKVSDADADMGTLGYVFTPAAAGKMKETEKAAGTAKFIWEGNNTGSGQVNGYNARTTNLLPRNISKGSGTNLHAGIFGNFSHLLIGQWAGLDVVVDNITLAGKAQVKLVINSWWDTAVLQPKSFTAITDIVAV